MPRRGAISLFITGIALALLLSFKTPETIALPGLNNQLPITNTGNNPAATDPAGNVNGNGTTTGNTGANTTGNNSSKSGTYTGQSVDTPFGPLQVAVQIQGGKISNVQILSYPSFHGRSVAINQYALPILQQETLQAQSANVNAVSGATYTSQAYMQSLQSALDQAH